MILSKQPVFIFFLTNCLVFLRHYYCFIYKTTPAAIFKEDAPRLNNAVMVQIAREYMERMSIKETLYIIGRHFDKKHPHVHILRPVSEKQEKEKTT